MANKGCATFTGPCFSGALQSQEGRPRIAVPAPPHQAPGNLLLLVRQPPSLYQMPWSTWAEHRLAKRKL